MSLQCPIKYCDRTFTKQQELTQHVRYRHPCIDNEQEEVQDNISNDDMELFQDENLFEEFSLFKKDLLQIKASDFINIKVSF